MTMLCIGDLVGLPFIEGGRDPAAAGGLDCWGLVVTVMARLGVTLPSYGDTVWTKDTDGEAVARVAIDEARGWREIVPGPDARPGDVALLNILGRPVHVGVVIAWPDILHAHKSAGMVVIDRLSDPRWRHRIAGLYRHPRLCAL